MGSILHLPTATTNANAAVPFVGLSNVLHAAIHLAGFNQVGNLNVCSVFVVFALRVAFLIFVTLFLTCLLSALPVFVGPAHRVFRHISVLNYTLGAHQQHTLEKWARRSA